MTTTPLPPLPYAEHGLCFFDEGGAHHCDKDGYTADQMQAYATQARADLEAENKRLREALDRIADPRNKHFSGDAQVVARAALEKQP